MKPQLRKTPDPIYLNQKEGALLLRVKEDHLVKFHKDGLLPRYPRQGKGFVYKISELLRLANDIDNGIVTIN